MDGEEGVGFDKLEDFLGFRLQRLWGGDKREENFGSVGVLNVNVVCEALAFMRDGLDF